MGGKERGILLILSLLLFIGFVGTANLINQRFSVIVPDEGGTIKEGVLGQPHFPNPLLAIADTDRDIVNLVYGGLMKPDGKGNLIPELAERYEISSDGLSYTFFLQKNAKFHDGKKITADDIIFTIESAKNPAIKSPYRAGWEGVGVEKIDENTVRFWLKKPYAPFLENTTIGILPKHLWKDITPEQISLSGLTIKPIGSGPYKISSISRNGSVIKKYNLNSFSGYVSEKSYINKIIFIFYPSEVEMISAYERGEINAISAVSPQNLQKIKRKDGIVKGLNLPRVFGLFFNPNEQNIFTEKIVRQALEMSADKKKIIKEVLGGYAKEISSPIPEGSFGALTNNDSIYDPVGAKALLEKNGWKFNNGSKTYEKAAKGQPTKELSFSISTSNAPDLVRTADILKKGWENIGVKVEIRVFENEDLKQNVIRTRKYDSLLYGEIVGRDPDPFAYWHSSQRNDPGLNLALYTSSKVDKILEDARSIVSREDRAQKYADFQKEIAADSPSIFLYSPDFIYVIPKSLKGFENINIVTPAERFSSVNKWYFDTRYVWKVLYKKS